MKFLLIAMLALTTINSQAARLGAPFPPAIDKRFDAIENDVIDQAGAARNYAKVTYDVAVDGGESTSHALGVTIPAGAVITSFYVYINTLFADSGTGSVALQCAGTRDLMEYQDLTTMPIDNVFVRTLDATVRGYDSTTLISASSAQAGRYSSATQVGSIPTACEVYAIVRSDAGHVAQTAGKLTAIIEYFIR